MFLSSWVHTPSQFPFTSTVLRVDLNLTSGPLVEIQTPKIQALLAQVSFVQLGFVQLCSDPVHPSPENSAEEVAAQKHCLSPHSLVQIPQWSWPVSWGWILVYLWSEALRMEGRYYWAWMEVNWTPWRSPCLKMVWTPSCHPAEEQIWKLLLRITAKMLYCLFG